jgi:hypothetical protein
LRAADRSPMAASSGNARVLDAGVRLDLAGVEEHR